MAICIQNIVWICITVIAVLLAVELTRAHTRRGMERTCRHICSSTQVAPNPADVAAAAALASATMPQPPIRRPPPKPMLGPYGSDLASALFPSPNMLAPLGFPINQITHGPVSGWVYCGYVFPSVGSKPGDGVRFPLYARRNLYQSYAFDYYVIDQSRNRVRINIELPNGVKELQSGDKVKLAGETGNFIVHIDIPADRTWQAFIPSPGFLQSQTFNRV